MPTPEPDLTLALVLTAGGALGSSLLITGLVEMFKRLIGQSWTAGVSRLVAFVLSGVLVVVAVAASGVELTIAYLFGAFLAWYAIARLSLANYDDATAQTNSLRGPVA